MTTLPIVDRELRVAARRSGTWWMRFAAAGLAMGIFFIIFATSDQSVAEMGETLFIALGIPTLGFAVLAGVFLTADSLSVERRDGTLGLLFLTDLKGYDVVFGKLSANSLNAFFGLLAVFPVLALPLLIGGVSGGEFWRCVLVFICALYFSLSIGMLVSAASRAGRQAMAMTFGIIVAIVGLLPLLWLMLSQPWLPTGPSSVPRWTELLWPNPAYAYIVAFDDTYLSRIGRVEFWSSIETIALVATTCIFSASVILGRSWQDTSNAEPERKPTRSGWLSKKPARRRPPLRNQKPFYWLARGDRAGQWATNRIIGVLFLLWGFCLVMGLLGRLAWNGFGEDLFYPLSIFLTLGLHFTAKLLMASEGGRRLFQDRQTGAMELLLVTPLPVDAIVKQQKDALTAQFRPIVWALTAVNFLNIAVLLIDSKHLDLGEDEMGVFSLIFLGGTAMIWLDSAALIWLGMWNGLKSKSHPRSVLRTLAGVMGVPWLSLFFFMFLADYLAPDESRGVVCVLLWFGFGTLIDIVAIFLARERLLASFRTLVAARYGG